MPRLNSVPLSDILLLALAFLAAYAIRQYLPIQRTFFIEAPMIRRIRICRMF